MFGNRKSKINVGKQDDLSMLMNVDRLKKPPPPSIFPLPPKPQAKRPKSGTVDHKWNVYSSATMRRSNPNKNSFLDQKIPVTEERRREFPTWFTNMVQHQITSPSPSSTIVVSSSNGSRIFVQGSWIERTESKASQPSLRNPDFTKKFSIAELVDVMCGNNKLDSLIQNESSEIFSRLPVLQERTNSVVSGLDFLQSNYNSMPFNFEQSRDTIDTGVWNDFMQQEEQNAMPFNFGIQPQKQKRPKSRKRRQADDAWDDFVQVLQQKQNSMPFDFGTAQQQQRPTSRASYDPNPCFSLRPQQDFLGGLAVIQSNYNSVALDFDSQQSQSLTQSQFKNDYNNKWDAFVDPFSV